MNGEGAMNAPALVSTAKVPHVPPTEDTILYRLYMPESDDPVPLVMLLPACQRKAQARRFSSGCGIAVLAAGMVMRII